MSRTEFRRVLWQNTMLAWFYREAEGDAEIVRGTLQGIGDLATAPGPVFALAHVLSPHLPYVLDSTCDVLPAIWYRDAASYVAQIQCVNHLVLAAVRRLIWESAVPPIIILQGDHGTAFLGYSDALAAGRFDPAAMRERLGAFGAYYLPARGEPAASDSISTVNVLGRILQAYFGAGLSPQPDEYYLSPEQSPFALLRVDAATLDSDRDLDSEGRAPDTGEHAGTTTR